MPFFSSEQWRGEQTDKAALETKRGLREVLGKLQTPATTLLFCVFIFIIKTSYDFNIHSKSRRAMVQLENKKCSVILQPSHSAGCYVNNSVRMWSVSIQL